MADFTNGDVFLDFFGSFWTRFLADSEYVRGIADGESFHIIQLYQEFVEAINALSLDTINPFHRELVYPIVLRRSQFSQGPDFVRFGDGVVFGPQPAGSKFAEGVTFQYGGLEKLSGLYYIGVPEKIKGVGRVITNGLIDPSVILVKDNDFIFQDDVIAFKQDPFANSLIPRRLVPTVDGTGEEEEIILWAANVDIERNDLFRQYGFAVSTVQASSNNYKQALQAVYKAYAAGPTPQVLDSLVAALAALPITKYATETVQSVEIFGSNQLVITDASVYTVPNTLVLRPNIQAGTVLLAGSPLTTGTQVFDRTTNSNWWTDLPFIAVGQDYLTLNLNSALLFNNEGAEVVLGDVTAAADGSSGRPATFLLTGDPRDVEMFWSAVQVQTVATGQFLGNLLYVKNGVVDENGAPDFTQSLYINPLELLSTDLLGDSLVVIKIRLQDFNEANPLFQNLRMLRDVMPAYVGLMIFVDVELDDTLSLVQAPTSLPKMGLTNTRDLLQDNVGNFDSTAKVAWQNNSSLPEVLSADLSPAIIAETLDMGTPANNAAAYGSEIPVCEEFIQGKLEEICTP